MGFKKSLAALAIAAVSSALYAEEAPKAEKKFDFAAGFTAVYQKGKNLKNEDGSKDKNGYGTVLADIEISRNLKSGAKIFFLFEAGSGAGIDEKHGSFSAYNSASGESDSKVSFAEAWYERSFGDILRVKAGKLDLARDFDTNAVANDEKAQFMSGSFVNNLSLELPESNAGAMVWLTPAKFLSIGGAVAESSEDWNDTFADPFYIGEVDFNVSADKFAGAYRFYGWYNGSNHEEFLSDRKDAKNSGFGLSLDQEIAGLFTIFGRCGMQNKKVSEVSRSWSAGFSIPMAFIERGDDSFGFAYGSGMISKDAKDKAKEADSSLSDERHLELFYSCMIDEDVFITPDFQWNVNPAGSKVADDRYIYGVRFRAVL